MKKIYTKPEVEIVALATEDIMALSATGGFITDKFTIGAGNANTIDY